MPPYVRVLVRVTLAVIKNYDQKQGGEDRLYLAILPHHCSSSKEVNEGTQTMKELGARS